MTLSKSHDAASGFRARCPAGRLLLMWTAAILALPAEGRAQQEVEAVLRGQVLKGGQPSGEGPVILHRVSQDSAGSIDSVAVAPDGTFSVQLPRLPDSRAQEMYFASIRFRDILYFGPAISEPADLDSLYVIQVYDTVAAPAGGQSFPIAVRNVFLEAVGDAWQVTDLFEIRNDGDRTYVGVDEAPVWVYPLPPEASNFQLGQSDLAPDAAGFSGHIFQVSAPVPPGERLYVLRYALPSLEVSFPTPGNVERMEVMVKEPAPPLTVTPLTEGAPVELEPGSTYRRFSGNLLGTSSVVLVPGRDVTGFPVRWLAVILGLTLAVAGAVAILRASPPRGRQAEAPVDDRQSLILEIARLDDWYEAREDPDEAERVVYQRRRAELKERLQELG